MKKNRSQKSRASVSLTELPNVSGNHSDNLHDADSFLLSSIAS
jgi:hypothetical protein